MLKKMLSRSSTKKFQQPTEGRSKMLKSKDTKHITHQNKNETVAEESMCKSKRQLYKFDLPENEQGFDDLLREYSEGSRFQYVALTAKQNETYESRVRKLVTFKAKLGMEVKPELVMPSIKLVEQSEQLNLSMAIDKKGKKEYIRLASVFGIYVPLVSVFTKYTSVIVSLHDSRMCDETTIQSVKFNSNIPQKFELSLDYCIPRSEASFISLNISREQTFMREDSQWAVMQLTLKLEESDFPYTCNLKEATAVMALPPSVLDNHCTNPNHLDTTMTEAQRRKVRNMYESGDIADEGEPIVEQTKPITYARTSIAAKVKGTTSGKEFKGEWAHVSNFRKPLVADDIASVDPEDDEEVEKVPSIEEEITRKPLRRVGKEGIQFNEMEFQ
nr:putative movement protein [Watermelon crinkle leaf-associated virus 1]